MRVKLTFSTTKKHEKPFYDAVVSMCERHGMTIVDDEAGAELVIMRGIAKGKPKNKPYLYLDKAYSRIGGRARISVNGHHPTDYIMDCDCDHDRRLLNGWEPEAYRDRPDGHVLICGSSAKFHSFHGLIDPNEWVQNIAIELRKHTDRMIVYRPKLSYHEARPVRGAAFSRARFIAEDLSHAHAVVTWGSNSVFETLLSGVPAIVCGNAVTRHISSTKLKDIENPHLASIDARRQLLANLAYHEWSVDEIADGTMWEFAKQWL